MKLKIGDKVRHLHEDSTYLWEIFTFDKAGRINIKLLRAPIGCAILIKDIIYGENPLNYRIVNDYNHPHTKLFK